MTRLRLPHDRRPTRRAVMAFAAAGAAAPLQPAHAATAAALSRDARTALEKLYAMKPKAREWGRKAKAILVFPSIVKAGAVVGGQSGEGAMLAGDQVIGFYRIAAASFGLQLGAQKFAYALFFMSDKAIDYLKTSGGWSVGTGPSLVLVDEGYAKSMTTATLTEDVYAVPFGQHGLMAGSGLEGSKISQFYPAP